MKKVMKKLETKVTKEEVDISEDDLISELLDDYGYFEDESDVKEAIKNSDNYVLSEEELDEISGKVMDALRNRQLDRIESEFPTLDDFKYEVERYILEPEGYNIELFWEYIDELYKDAHRFGY